MAKILGANIFVGLTPGFSQARSKLALTAMPRLNDWLIARAEQDRFVSRWRGMGLVAADASMLRFGLRASHVKRATLNQILFGLLLPGPDPMLAATLHSETIVLKECR